jgi:ATP-dependent Clp protease ATP-binding subunit ClpA
VERQIENPLAMKIVQGQCPDNSKVTVKVENKEVVFLINGKE